MPSDDNAVSGAPLSELQHVRGVVIAINSMTLGFEIPFPLEDQDTQMGEPLEHIFLAIYAAELALRFAVLRFAALRDKSVIFVCGLVSGDMLDT